MGIYSRGGTLGKHSWETVLACHSWEDTRKMMVNTPSRHVRIPRRATPAAQKNVSTCLKCPNFCCSPRIDTARRRPLRQFVSNVEMSRTSHLPHKRMFQHVRNVQNSICQNMPRQPHDLRVCTPMTQPMTMRCGARSTARPRYCACHETLPMKV